MTTEQLQSRALGAIGIGIVLAIVGGIVLNRQIGAFDQSTGGLIAGWVLLTLGGMTVQAGIVGIVFSGQPRSG